MLESLGAALELVGTRAKSEWRSKPLGIMELVQAPERPALMPSEGVLALHDSSVSYADFAAFQPIQR